MNTTQTVTLAPARADELAGLLDGLLHWLTTGNSNALADLEDHLGSHASTHGGAFDHDGGLSQEDSILDTYTTLIAAYHAELGWPDQDGDDR